MVLTFQSEQIERGLSDVLKIVQLGQNALLVAQDDYAEWFDLYVSRPDGIYKKEVSVWKGVTISWTTRRKDRQTVHACQFKVVTTDQNLIKVEEQNFQQIPNLELCENPNPKTLTRISPTANAWP